MDTKRFASIDGAIVDLNAIEAVSTIFNSPLGEDLVMFTITLSSGETIRFNRLSDNDNVEELMAIRDELVFKLL